jgi:ribonuclease J
MTVFEYEGKLLIVDCGVLFPEDNQPGIDLILPDFSYIRDRLDDVVAIFLTHGHEDHIGAVPYLLKERVDIPIYGSPLTIALITAKCKEKRIGPITYEVREGQRQLLPSVHHLFHLASSVAEQQPGSGQRGYRAVRKAMSWS